MVRSSSGGSGRPSRSLAPGPGYYAHTDPAGGLNWQDLAEHLRAVAAGARLRSESFGAADWGHLAGLWHDLGKYSEAFQAYLREAAAPDTHLGDALSRIDHSTAGARHAANRLGPLGQLLSYVIAGHHSGLLDSVGEGASLERRLRKDLEPWDRAPPGIVEQPEPALPPYLRDALGRKDRVSISFFVRMVFSALVDADFLDTEAFMSPERAAARPRWPTDVLDRMLEALEARIAAFGPPQTQVDRRRAEVAASCRAAAERPQGLFSLTVPTGGGKTLSSLLFALHHARRHALRQIVYVAPFTSIIEQNAEEYRKVFATLVTAGVMDPVVEHHSSVEVSPEEESGPSRLAAENWDAPLVVTTAVQFYESLYGSRPSRSRKLHRLARSVVILDEAQSIPVDYLHPCLRAIEVLTVCFGTSVVLCTATQPAIHRRVDFPIGLDVPPDREIIPDPEGLFKALRRVRVEVAGKLADAELAERMLGHEQVLCVVNTRRHARMLTERLGRRPGHIHLSALMCPEHRSQVLAKVKKRLAKGDRCRVVSTQLIEAGVDVDFPAVYRALSGLDSVAQAAGRCNRNGRQILGVTTVFESEHTASEAFVKDVAASARPLLEIHEDLLGLDAIEHYFRLHYWEQSARWDRKRILDRFQLRGTGPLPFLFDFASAARDFRLIEEQGHAVIVPWGEEGEALCDALRNRWPHPDVGLLRRLQRYMVQLPDSLWRRHRESAFEIVHDHYPVLAFPHLHYSDWTGLTLEADPGEALVR
jgi:CRISPR-associated endonuclease/helicase Cas3